MQTNPLINKIKDHYKKAETLGYSVVGAFLYGYSNFNILTEEEMKVQKIKSKVVVIPTLSTVLSKQTSEPRIIDDGENKIEIIDINSVYTHWLNGNPTYLELLFTDYKVINPQYTSLIRTLIDLKEEIAAANKTGFCKEAVMLAQKYADSFSASLAEESYNAHCLYYVAHLYYMTRNFIEKERTFEQSLIEIPETLKYFYHAQNLDGSELSAEDAAYKINYYFNVLKINTEELSTLKLEETPLSKTSEVYDKVFAVVTDIIQYGLTNILSGNSDEIKKLNALVVQTNKKAEEKEARIKELTDKHENELKMKDTKWRTELDSLTHNYQTQLSAKENEIESIRKSWVEKLIAVKQENEEGLQDIRSQLQQDYAEKTKQLEKEFKIETEQLENQLLEKENEIRDLELNHRKSIENIKEEYDFQIRNIEEINKSVLESHQNQIETLNQKLTAFSQQTESEREEWKNQKISLESDLSEAKQKLFEIQKDNEDYKELVKDLEQQESSSDKNTEPEELKEEIRILTEQIINKDNELERLKEQLRSLMVQPQPPVKKHWWY